MAYSKAQLEVLWEAVNPGKGDPHLMAAIALAESAGDPGSTNSIGACGLWQIHPYEAGCLNATTNAKMAGQKLASQGLGAWETYTNGAYKQFYTGPTAKGASLLVPGAPGGTGPLGPAELPLETLLEGGTLGVPSIGGTLGEGVNKALGGVLGAIPGDFNKIYELLFTPKGWVRIGKVLVGLFLLLMGVTGMANISPPPIVKDTVTAGALDKAATVGLAA